MAALEGMLARHRAVSVAMLAVLAVLAWIWLALGAGTGMAPGHFLPPVVPHELSPAGMTAMGAGGGMPLTAGSHWWPVPRFLLTFSMWWVMMVAMMLPSATPVVLLYGRVALTQGAPGSPANASFLCGYLLVWGLFSCAAAAMQMLLEHAGMMAGMGMVSASRPFSAAVLIVAGLYQLSPLKDACLHQCRDPARFLVRHYRPGKSGALRMGILHGAFCAGCCWLLMALLFVGGVMNLVWIAFLTLLVAAEKLLPGGRAVAMAGGLACLTWGGLIAVLPLL